MFELVNNISEVNFVNVVVEKTKTNWRDELVAFGLINSGLSFKIEGSIAPLYLSIADTNFTAKFGNSPRVTIPKSALEDRYFIAVCEKFNINVIKNCGTTIEGYDFHDNKTAQELSSFLVGFEQAYRTLKVTQ